MKLDLANKRNTAVADVTAWKQLLHGDEQDQRRANNRLVNPELTPELGGGTPFRT